MSGLSSSGYTRHGGHVDWPGEMSVLHHYRVANLTDGDIVKRQFYGESLERSPEARLLLAILDRAIADLAMSGSAQMVRLARMSAANWVLSDGDGPFAFRWVCEGLGLDAGYVRAGIVERFGVKGR